MRGVPAITEAEGVETLESDRVVDNHAHQSHGLPNADFCVCEDIFHTNCCGINSRSEESRSKTGARNFLSLGRPFFNTKFLRINKSTRKPRSKKTKNVSN